jgi:aminoglycoside phosphotransferase family enzyme/predicted kinase
MAQPLPGQAAAAAQQDVIAFLSDPGSYPGVERVECTETHGNIVFLAGAEAWKIKRAVAFPYMDFSTLEKRHAACRRELEINRHFGSALYLGCVPIVRLSNGKLAFGSEGEIVEWAVRMHRFEQAALLSQVARRSGIGDDLAAELADLVYASHQKADRSLPSSGVKAMLELARSIATTLAASALAHDQVEQLAGKLNVEISTATGVLNKRAAKGCVRRCHGDLHLANIVIWEGHPALYDAIEFDEAMATIDVFYDLAFLLMDLDQSGQRAAANVVLNRYLWRSASACDFRGMVALPLFLALRAAVRAMVAADRAAQQSAQARRDTLAAAGGYLRAALKYLARERPRLLAIGGLSGSGKTTVAARLAPGLGAAPGAVHLRTDLVRKRLAGVGEFERLPEAAYSAAARERIYQVLREQARWLLEAGHSVVIDAVFAEQDERQDMQALAVAAGVPFMGLWLNAKPQMLRERVAARQKDASDATIDVVDRQLQIDAGPFTLEWKMLEAGGSPSDTLASARALLKHFETRTP